MISLIFDLDDTLYPASSIPKHVAQPVLNTMLVANSTLNEFDIDEIYKIYEDLWKIPFDQIKKKYLLSARFYELVNDSLKNLILTEQIHAYDDIEAVENLKYKKFLVTTGYEKLQYSKIEMLGIGHFFNEIIIDSLNDPSKRKGKKKIFEELIEKHHLSKKDLLIIGDNPDSELKAGRELGVKSIQILRNGVSKDLETSIHINTLYELTQYL